MWKTPETRGSLQLTGKLVLGVLLALLPVLVLLALGWRADANELRHETFRGMRGAADAASILADEYLAEARKSADLLATHAAVRSLSPLQIEPLLDEVLNGDPNLHAIAVVDEDGRPIASTSDDLLPARGSEVGELLVDAVELANRGEGLVSGAAFSRGRGLPLVVASAPIRQGDRTVGAVLVGYDLGTLASRLQRLPLPDDAELFLIDPAGRLAFRCDTVHVLAGDAAVDVSKLAATSRALGGERILVAEEFAVADAVGLQQRPVALALVPTPTWRWVVGVVRPTASALAPIERRELDRLVLMVALSLVAMGGAALVGLHIVRPIRQLAVQLEAFGRGDLQVRSDLHTGDELESLAGTFNSMAGRLQQVLGTLEAQNAELQAIAVASRAVVRELELGGVARVIVEQTGAVLRPDFVVLWLADGRRRELVLLDHAGLDEGEIADVAVVSFDTQVAAARAAREKRLLVLEDPAALPPLRPLPRLQSGICLPLLLRDELVGEIVVGSASPRQFGPLEVRLLTALGDIFSAAVENARLHDRVRQTLRLRDEFIAAAAHELRTPATALKAWVQILARDPRDDRDRKILERLHFVAERAARLARELVAVHGLTAEQRPLECRPVELHELVRAAEQAVRAFGSEATVHFTSEGAVEIEADAESLALALGALLENAARNQGGKGAIAVEIRDRGGFASVRIQDAGPAIPAGRLPHLFEPLFEPWPSGSPHYVGRIGLGLHLASIVAASHGGRIDATSGAGGTTLELLLPARRGSGVAPLPAGGAGAPAPDVWNPRARGLPLGT